jgi:hypothetical protein
MKAPTYAETDNSGDEIEEEYLPFNKRVKVEPVEEEVQFGGGEMWAWNVIGKWLAWCLIGSSWNYGEEWWLVLDIPGVSVWCLWHRLGWFGSAG